MRPKFLQNFDIEYYKQEANLVRIFQPLLLYLKHPKHRNFLESLQYLYNLFQHELNRLHLHRMKLQYLHI